MKKLLSMILAVAMVMSLFCAVPAGAASTPVEHSFPYIIENFEDGDVSFFGETENRVPGEKEAIATAAGEGYAASENAAKITYKGNANTIGNYLYNSDGSYITGKAKKGETFTASFWMKSEQKLNATNLLLVLWAPGNYWRHNAQVTFDGTNNGWQKVTMSYTYAVDADIERIELRFGNTGATNRVVDAEGTPTDENRVYYVDDFEMQISRKVVTERVYAYSEVASLTPTDGSSWDGIEILQQGSTDTQTVVTEGTNTFLRHTHSAAAPIWLGIKLQEPMKAGHTYVLTFKNRVRGLPLADGTLDPAGPAGGTGFNYVNYQSDIPYSGSTWTGSGSAGHYESWSVHSAATRQTGRGPYVDIRWNGGSATAYADWHDVSITYASTKQNIEENMSNVDYIRVGIWLYNGAGSNLGTFDFDDFKVLDLGPLTNGGFENTKLAGGAGIHDGSNSSQWKGNSKLAGWHMTNPHGTTQPLQSTCRIPTENTAEHSDKWGALYYQHNASAEIYQYVPVYAGESYTITGYVRGASGTKGRVRLVADFTGATLDQEVYNVLGLGTNGVIYGDWVEYPDQWDMSKPVSLTIDLTNIETIPGRNQPANTKIMPKSPKVSIQFDESWAGNVNPPNGGSHAVYMDAFTMKRNATEGAPTISAVNVSGDIVPGEKLNVSYNFAAAGAVTDASIIKLMAKDGDNVACLASYKKTDDIIVPDSALGRDVYVEIVPASKGTDIGMALDPIVVEEITSDYEIDFDLGDFVDSANGGKKVTATATVSGLTPALVGRNVDAVIVVALYDANGAFVNFVEEDIALTAGMAQTTFTCSYDQIGLNIKYAKAFIWECDVPTSGTASITNSTMRSLAPFAEAERQ